MTESGLEWVIASCLVAGSFFVFVAGLGILRMPDTLIRMHASTKAGTLGLGLVLIALMLSFAEPAVTARGTAAIIFVLITAPVAAHMIGRAAYRTGTPLWDKTLRDELPED
ncbi:MAG: monovalent cation/H(+) antiporter subunit G [Alphaproteobacteria bacterium]|nr:monovalent cation/H(+) antiporter subunit G [Alphaproteobacteria bacterium]